MPNAHPKISTVTCVLARSRLSMLLHFRPCIQISGNREILHFNLEILMHNVPPAALSNHKSRPRRTCLGSWQTSCTVTVRRLLCLSHVLADCWLEGFWPLQNEIKPYHRRTLVVMVVLRHYPVVGSITLCGQFLTPHLPSSGERVRNTV